MAERNAGPDATTPVPAGGNAHGDGERGNADFVQHASRERERVDRLLASAEQRWWRPASGQKPRPGDPEIKRGEGRDPEFVKNLRIFGRLVDGAIDLWTRVEPSAAEGEGKRSAESGDMTAGSRAGQPDARLPGTLWARKDLLCERVKCHWRPRRQEPRGPRWAD